MDEDTPSFVRRTKARASRGRPATPVEDVQADENDGESSPSTLAAKLKNKHKSRQKTKSRLSFGVADEEVCIIAANRMSCIEPLTRGKEGDGEAFQVKKSNLSRKLKLGSAASPLYVLFWRLRSTTYPLLFLGLIWRLIWNKRRYLLTTVRNTCRNSKLALHLFLQIGNRHQMQAALSTQTCHLTRAS